MIQFIFMMIVMPVLIIVLAFILAILKRSKS